MLRRGRSSGFTLVEILVVMVILVILATAFIFSTGLLKRPGQAKQAVATSKISQLKLALYEFHLDTGRFPETAEGLQALVEAPADLEEKWKGPYCDAKDLIDPWDRPFLYGCPGTNSPSSFDLSSLGADGADGGEDENKDIVSW